MSNKKVRRNFNANEKVDAVRQVLAKVKNCKRNMHRTFFGLVRQEALRPCSQIAFSGAKKVIEKYVRHYKNNCLHSASGYVALVEVFKGTQEEIFRKREENVQRQRKEVLR